MKRPLLVVDGDSLAHRAYHALPKTFRRAEGKPGNALLGFSNFIVRLWQAEELRVYRRMATLDASAPLPPLQDQTPKWAEASSFVRDLGLNALADRLAALDRTSTS